MCSIAGASAEAGANCVATVEYMQKLPDKYAAALSLSMAFEWKSILMPLFFDTQTYWTPESVLCL